MNQDHENSMYDIADKFIYLANELDSSGNSGKVGSAIRFAAARYSAFVASLSPENLSDEKEKQLELITEDFNKMLLVNIEDYIKRQP